MKTFAITSCAFLVVASALAGAKEQPPTFPAGESYPTVKETLLAAGWRAVPVDRAILASQVKPYGYDEMVCGAGYQAACSANFAKAGQIICMQLVPRGSTAVYVSTGPEC